MPSIRRANVQFSVTAEYAGDVNGVEQDIVGSFLARLTNGTGTDQANRAFKQTYTIAASGNQVVNLTSMTDNLGNALVLTKLKALFILHKSTSLASGVTVGGGTQPLFGTKIVGIEVLPGDVFPFVCRSGYTISSGTADRIRIVNADAVNAATVEVVFLASQ